MALLPTATARGASPEPNVVCGTLVAADGSPVAGATVLLLGYDTRSVVSDANGRFCFREVPPMFHPYEVFARGGNLITKKAMVHKLDGSRAVLYESPHLVLTAGKQAKFIITSKTTGKPIPGARVQFEGDDARTVLTDKAGIALIPGLKPVVYVAMVRADGFAREIAAIDLLGPNTTSDFPIHMEPGGIVRGIVVDDLGKPVPGVPLRYSEADAPEEHAGKPSGSASDEFQTDKNGRFEERCAPLDVSLRIYATDDPILNADDLKEVCLSTEQPEADLRIVIDRPGEIRAKVVDAETGKPVRAFRVQAGPPFDFESGDRIAENRSWPNDSSDAKDGQLKFQFIDRTAVSLTVEAEGYESNVVRHVRA